MMTVMDRVVTRREHAQEIFYIKQESFIKQGGHR